MEHTREWFFELNGGTKGAVFYKGFKIYNDGESYRIVDIRYNDFYQEVSEQNMSTLIEHGIVAGASLIMYNRDLHRERLLENRIVQLQEQKDDIRQTKDDGKNEKRIKILTDKILDYVDLMFLYSHRARQYEERNGLY